MAKRARTVTLGQMEKELGYVVDVPSDDFQNDRFYSDLVPVFKSSYDRTKKELEEHRKRISQGCEYITANIIPELGKLYTFNKNQVKIFLKRHTRTTYFGTTLDVCYDFGLKLPLLLAENEISRLEPITKPNDDSIESRDFDALKLPRELRDIIYEFAIPPGSMQLADPSTFFETYFPGSICDPSGFYFPLTQSIGALRVNKQMRQEALPIAYRRTLFQLDDIDDFIKFAIVIGDVGRDNVESLEFFWLSRSDSEFSSRKTPGTEDDYPKLPALHVSRCVQLLKQCKRLKFLRLLFDEHLLSTMSIGDFKADSGICELTSIQPLETVEVCGFEYQPLEHESHCARWLKEEIQSPK